MQTPGSMGNAMFRGLFNELAHADVRTVLQYVPKLDGPQRRIAMRSLGYKSASADIRKSIELSGQLDESIREPFVDAVVDYALRATREREIMIEFFDAIPVQALKNRAAETLLYENEWRGFLSKAERQKFYLVLDQDQRTKFDEYIASRLKNFSGGPSRTD